MLLSSGPADSAVADKLNRGDIKLDAGLLEALRPPFSIMRQSSPRGAFEFYPCVIVFCGITYRGVTVHHWPRVDQERFSVVPTIETFYDYARLEQYAQASGFLIHDNPRRMLRTEPVEAQAKAFLDRQGTNEMAGFARLYDCAVLVLAVSPHDTEHKGYCWSTPAALEGFGFYKVMNTDAAEAALSAFGQGLLPA